MPRPSAHRLQAFVPAHTPAFVPEAGAVPFPGYKLVRLRGKGGFATVWEADAPGGERIALKFMSTDNLASTAREVRSLQALMAVRHPNLLRTRDVWSLPGGIAIGMDLADGSLLDLLYLHLEEFGRPIAADELGRHMAEVADALDFLNARRHRIDGRLVGLQHGDVKPNNILLIGDRPHLADYGLATPTLGPVTPCPRHGTSEFCAPEVFAGLLSDASDQFGLAVTYFVLRTGTFPFPPPPPRDQLKGYRRPPPDLSAVPAGERPAFARALAAIPPQRFGSCREFVGAVLAAQGLRADRGDDGAVTVGPAAPPPAPPGSRIGPNPLAGPPPAAGHG